MIISYDLNNISLLVQLYRLLYHVLNHISLLNLITIASSIEYNIAFESKRKVTTVSYIKIDFLFHSLEAHTLCNMNLYTSAGAMTIPNNPSYLHQNLDCKLIIDLNYADHIILRWIEFGPQLFQETSSCLNYIAIYKQISNSPNLVTKICSASNRTTIPITSSHLLYIHYHVHNYNHLKNFRFFYLGGEYPATDVNTIGYNIALL